MQRLAFFVIAAIIFVGLLLTVGDDPGFNRQFGRAAGWSLLAVSVAVAAAIVGAVAHRRRIARAADEAAIATLATGVKAKRKIGEKAEAYRQRIIDRADEPDSPAR